MTNGGGGGLRRPIRAIPCVHGKAFDALTARDDGLLDGNDIERARGGQIQNEFSGGAAIRSFPKSVEVVVSR